MLITRKFFPIILVCLILVGEEQPTTIFAQEERCLRISEVYPAPLMGKNEWVEIWNCGDSAQNLTGFKLLDQISTPTELIDLSGLIVPDHGYLAIDLFESKLNNTGDGVTFKDPDSNVIDEMSYTTTQTGKSWSLLKTLDQYVLTEPTNGLPNPEPTATPTITPTLTPSPTPTKTPTPRLSPTISSTPTPTPTRIPTLTPTITPGPTIAPIDRTKLQLTEVVACPSEGETEWLELFWTGENNFEFKNWQLVDLQNNKVTLSGNLVASNYTVVSWSNSILNNTGDHLFLYDQTGQELVNLNLPACQVGQSYALIGSGFELTSIITKGFANHYPPSPTPTPSPNFQNVLGVSTTAADIDEQLPFSSTYPNKDKSTYLSNVNENTTPNPSLPSLDQNTKAINSNQPTTKPPLATIQPPIALSQSASNLSWPPITAIMGGLSTLIGSLAVLYEQKKAKFDLLL